MFTTWAAIMKVICVFVGFTSGYLLKNWDKEFIFN